MVTRRKRGDPFQDPKSPFLILQKGKPEAERGRNLTHSLIHPTVNQVSTLPGLAGTAVNEGNVVLVFVGDQGEQVNKPES